MKGSCKSEEIYAYITLTQNGGSTRLIRVPISVYCSILSSASHVLQVAPVISSRFRTFPRCSLNSVSRVYKVLSASKLAPMRRQLEFHPDHGSRRHSFHVSLHALQAAQPKPHELMYAVDHTVEFYHVKKRRIITNRGSATKRSSAQNASMSKLLRLDILYGFTRCHQTFALHVTK